MGDRTEAKSDGLVLYEVSRPRSNTSGSVAVISLNRVRAANAQSLALIYALDDCLQKALADPTVRCIVLRANGKHFSAGHDLNDRSGVVGQTWAPRSQWQNFSSTGYATAKRNVIPPSLAGKNGENLAEGMFNREREIYKDMAERWRNAPKPTVCAVQGKCIAGGLMLCWPTDIIVAADNAQFQDPVVAMGVCGVEYFAHQLEMGSRRAKEMLFTGQSISAVEARDLFGFVSHVVPRGTLDDFTLNLAHKIAANPMFALQMSKEAVNQAEDAAGRQQGMSAAFSLHQLCHAYNMQRFGIVIDPTGLIPRGKNKKKKKTEVQKNGQTSNSKPKL